MTTILLLSALLLHAPSRIFLLSPEIEQASDIVVRLIDDKVFVLNRVGKETADTTDGDMMEYKVWELTRNTEMTLLMPQETVDHAHFVSMNVQDSRVIIQELQHILVFDRSANQQFTLISSHEMDPGYVHGRFIGDSIIVCNDVRLSRNRFDTKLFRSSISMQTMEKGATILYPESRGNDLTHVQPRRLMDCSARLVAIADAADYHIRVSDRITGQSWSITTHPHEWTVRDTLPAAIGTQDQPQRSFGALMKYVKANSVVSTVTAVDDSTLCVCWTIPASGDEGSSPSLVYDIWSLNADVWSMRDRRIVSTRLDDDAPYELHDVWTKILNTAEAGQRIDVVVYPGRDLSNTSWPTRSAYNAECESYFVQNPLQYALVITPIVQAP